MGGFIGSILYIVDKKLSSSDLCHNIALQYTTMPSAPKVPCRKCGKKVARTYLKKHEKACGELKGPRVPCVECDKDFQDEDGLQSHIRKAHSNEKHPCTGPDCDKVFDSKDKLRNHFAAAHTDKFACTCGARRGSMQNLKKHISDMIAAGKDGHEPMEKKVVAEPIVGAKRKAAEMDPVQKFFDAMDDRLNQPNPLQPFCLSKKLCTTTRLSHGFPGGHRQYCSNHQDEVPGLVDLCPLCKYVGCATRGHCVIVTATGQLNFCPEHMRQLIREGLPNPDVSAKWPTDYGKKCIEEGCGKAATYDGGQYCKPHSPTKISDDARVCEVPGCEVTRPAFAYPGKTPRRCAKHKEEGMYSHALCHEEGCCISASYGAHGRQPTHCGAHRLPGEFLQIRTCAEPGCDMQPSFGPPEGLVYTHCSRHKQEGYVDLRNKSCAHEMCTKNPSFGAEGGQRMWCGDHKTDTCVNLVATICAMACCSMVSGGDQAKFFHPEHEDEASPFYKKRICYFGRRVLIEDALMHNDIRRLESLMDHFKMDRVLTLNAQSAFRFACEKLYHPLLKDCVDIVFDGTVANGPKVLGALRPDIFYKWCIDGVNYGIHIEYDETTNHEDDLARLKCIAEQADCLDRVYVIRVCGGEDAKNPACTRVRMENFEYFKVTGEGKKVASDVADAVKERIGWIEQGLGPCGTRPSKIGL